MFGVTARQGRKMPPENPLRQKRVGIGQPVGPLAGLGMVPIIAKEGVDGLRGALEPLPQTG